MNVLKYLQELKKTGIRVELADGQLKIAGDRSLLTPELVQELKANKQEIMDYLEGRKTGFNEIPVAEKRAYYPLTPAQKRLYFLQQMTPDATVYNLPQLFYLGGEIDRERIKNAFHQLVQRHDSLRTSFRMEGEEPVQVVSDEAMAELDSIETGSIDGDGVLESFVRPFDLGRAPLVRAAIVREGDTGYWLMMDIHHIVTDGISQQVMQHEFLQLYQGADLPMPKLQYKDFTQWQYSPEQQERIKAQGRYWQEKLDRDILPLELPGDWRRPAQDDNAGAGMDFRLSEEETKRLKIFAEENGLTLYMVVLAGFSAFLSKLSGREELVVGTAVNGRNHHDLQDITGMFVNALAIPMTVKREMSVTDLLQQARQNSIEAFENQEYPFDDLVEALGAKRVSGRNPLFDVMINMSNDATEEEDATTDSFIHTKRPKRFDLTLNVSAGSRLSFNFQYWTRLFSPSTIERFARYFKNVLTALPGSSGTVAELSLIPENEKKEIEKRILSREPTEVNYFPASFHQQRLWFIDEFENGHLYAAAPVYHNVPLILKLSAAVNPELLKRSIEETAAQLQSLRTRLFSDGKTIYQIIADPGSIALNKYPAIGDVRSPEGGLNTDLRNEIESPFMLDQGELIRAAVFGNGSPGSIVVVTVHHAVTDHYSMELIAKRIARNYASLLRGETSGPGPGLQYVDYSEWERLHQKELFPHFLSYWKIKLSGKLAALELPTDIPREKIHIYESALRVFTIPAELKQQLITCSRNAHVPLRTVLLGAFKILLGKYCRQEEVIVGTSIDGREDQALREVSGPLSNLLTLRSFINPSQEMQEFLQMLDTTVEEARRYSMPFDKLVLELNPEKDMSRTALFDVLFRYEEDPLLSVEQDGIKFDLQETNTGWGKYDLNLLLKNEGDQITGYLVYNSKYYFASTIAALTGHYLNVLAGMQQSRLAGDPDLLSPAEKAKLLRRAELKTVFPEAKTLHGIFEEQAAKTPMEVALVSGRQTMSYSELNTQSNQLARVLLQKGVRAGTVVGIVCDRGFEMIISILAILKAGGTYLPIDPAYPSERKTYMLDDSKAAFLVVQDIYRNSITTTAVQVSASERTGSEENPDLPLASSATAYIIYTSGTTGQPKGAMISHRNVVSLLFHQPNWFDFNASDTWTMFHSYCFDFSVWEMYGALLHGGKLVIVPKETARDPHEFMKLLSDEKVTVLNQTPGAFRGLMNAWQPSVESATELRYVIFGGEALNPGMLKAWHERYPETRLINMYGITETTVHVTYKEIGAEEIERGTSNIGVALPSLHTYVLDSSLKQVPPGIPGELFVSGEGVCSGYTGREKLTEEKFIDNPFQPGTKMYRSGDLVKLTAGGELEYLGRIDEQVKIRGYRIELGEIENGIKKFQGIRDAVVVPRGSGPEKILCAYYISRQETDKKELRTFLLRLLPDYMVPAHFTRIERIPVTSNGKVDRNALPAPETMGSQEQHEIKTPAEEKLIAIWAEVLEIEKEAIDTTSNFFDLGGNSLRILKVVSMIKKEFGVLIPLMHIYNSPIVKDIARAISNNVLYNNRINFFNAEKEKNIFCFPPASSYGFCYLELANAIGDHRLCCFNYQKSENEVNDFVEEILKVQPESPYVLLGYSGGGKVLYPVARELERRGKTVASLILLDAYWNDYKGQTDYAIHLANIEDVISRTNLDFLRDDLFARIRDYDQFMVGITYSDRINTDVHVVVSEGHAHKESAEHMREERDRITATISKYITGTCKVYQGHGLHASMLSDEFSAQNAAVVKEILALHAAEVNS